MSAQHKFSEEVTLYACMLIYIYVRRMKCISCCLSKPHVTEKTITKTVKTIEPRRTINFARVKPKHIFHQAAKLDKTKN